MVAPRLLPRSRAWVSARASHQTDVQTLDLRIVRTQGFLVNRLYETSQVDAQIPSPMQQVISARMVSTGFGERETTNTIGDQVGRVALVGEMLMIMGPSGSGKPRMLPLVSGIP